MVCSFDGEPDPCRADRRDEPRSRANGRVRRAGSPQCLSSRRHSGAGLSSRNEGPEGGDAGVERAPPSSLIRYATPSRALALVAAIGSLPRIVRVIGCEVEEVDDYRLGLSPPVELATDRAADMAIGLIKESAPRHPLTDSAHDTVPGERIRTLGAARPVFYCSGEKPKLGSGRRCRQVGCLITQSRRGGERWPPVTDDLFYAAASVYAERGAQAFLLAIVHRGAPRCGLASGATNSHV
jgi:hypothetical protein